MPAEKNRTLRVVVPIIVALAAIGVAVAFFINATGGGTGGSKSRRPADASATQQTAQPASGQPETTTEAEPEKPAESDGAPAPPAPALTEPAAAETTPIAGEIRARTFPAPDGPIVLGSIDPDSGYRLEVELTALGAGIESVRSSYYYKTIAHREHYPIQQRQSSADGSRVAVPLSVTGIIVNGKWVNLFNANGDRLWRVRSNDASSAVFEAFVETGAGEPLLRLERRYTLDADTFDIRIRQQVENLGAAPVEFSFVQLGPVELPEDTGGYRIPLDRVRFGALLEPKRDPSQTIIEGDRKLYSGQSAIKLSVPKLDDQGRELPPVPLWPNKGIYEGYGELVWAAQTSRYFGAIVHSTPDEGQAKRLWAAERVFPQSLLVQDAKGNFARGALHLELHSDVFTAAPGETVGLPMGFYAGPMAEKYLSADADPLYGRIAMDEIVIYQLSFGMCAICTFQWLADLLHAFLSFLHKYVVFDWALAIMVLVVVVRTILHPITKRSQIAMMRFSKQMQALAPKQKAIQEKYKDDRVKMQQEMTRLMREEGVNYAGMLGCLPMFLQTPIWIALYAMLYIAFDLRHEPAFFGAVQAVFPNWSFLGDLSVGDHFIYFGKTLFSLPLMGDITGINILPILMGVVFYIQQKYMTPPSSAQLTPEQQSQQKMMKIMMIVMFPVFMYNAPAALSVYFITNSTLGILESRYIRSHIDQDALVPEKPKHAGLGRKKVANRAKSPFKKGQELPRRYKDRQ